jgi:tryptophanyl-tRNA synthetase
MKTVFSGIQPSGELHLGNYLGAVRSWVEMQESFYCIICVVDYHAITQTYEPKQLAQRSREMVTDLVACGIDPDRSVLFIQSQVPEHTELAWVLNAVTPFGDLSRMTQFKDKAARQEENINVGLFDYPVLQAADILLYRAQLVPVGQDQVQHVELTRRIARAFNGRWGRLFPEPEPKLSSTPKILGLDGQAKMSKSLDNTISLGATDKQIRKSLARAATDPARVTRQDPGDPFKCNIHTLHTFFSTADELDWVRTGCSTAGIGCVDCKGKLADNVIEHLTPIRARRAALIDRPDEVSAIVERGRARASELAEKTMAEVRKKVGLWRPGAGR